MTSNRSRYAHDASEASSPEPSEGTPVGEHTHEQPRSTLVLVLTAATVVLSLTVVWLLYTSYTLQKSQSEFSLYLEGRGAQRDAENQQLQQDINDAVCSVLDNLPAGALFGGAREQYGCGPGVPISELDPATAQNLVEILEQGQAPTTAAEPSSEPTEAVPSPSGIAPPAGAVITPPAGPSAAPSQQSQPAPTQAPAAPAPVTPAPTPAAPTTPAPIADLSGVTDAVCGLLRVCA